MEQGSDTFAATGISRTNYALLYLYGAASCARRVHKIEKDNARLGFGPFFSELMHMVPSCVMLATGCLEAFANELFADGAPRFPGASSQLVDLVWELAEESPILKKYEVAARLAGVPSPVPGRNPYQNVAALIDLRNALVHFNPESTNEADEHRRLSARLANKFEGSPFLPGEPLFPRAFVSHSCCDWAVKSVVAFLADFQAAMNLEPKIEARDPQLVTSDLAVPSVPRAP